MRFIFALVLLFELNSSVFAAINAPAGNDSFSSYSNKSWRKKKIKICGHELQVPVLAYAVCHGAIYALPVSCTVGASTTAGTSCALAIGLASASCGLSFSVLGAVASDCIRGK